MKIEKITENKIRITLNLEDLKSKNIDFHSFMSNSLETQNLFMEMLDEVEKQIGFVTKNYKLSIEAIATPNDNFILTVTRLTDAPTLGSKKVHTKRKTINLNHPTIIFKFNSFDDVSSLCDFIKNNSYYGIYSKLLKNTSLYFYEDYYLVIDNPNIEQNHLKTFCSIVSEFGKYINNSDLFENKLKEYGKVIIKKNAINTIINKYVKK